MAEITFIMLLIQMGTVILCLLFGSYMDLIKREVSDIPWIIMAIVGLITTIIYIIFSENKGMDGTIIGINLGVGIAIGLILYYTGMMGGADAKAIMALSLNTAIYPFVFELTSTPVYAFVPPIFNTFFNWLLTLVLIYPLPLLFYNIYLKIKKQELFKDTNANFASKILMMISGYLIPVEKARDRTDIVYSEVYNVEEEEWEIKHFMQVPEIEEEEKYKEEVETFIQKTKRENIWVKILPPGIVFLLIGYVINIFLGNILFTLYHWFL
ncbi:MAG: prepilin peptidase [Candidatus Heimdallarchaeota archaeon]|nr:prepilin peptidase [Candidatus Heimdallarchaeota archaeon]